MRIICPACGVSSVVPADNLSGVVHCAGCGKRIRFAKPVAAPQVEVETAEDDSVDLGLNPAEIPAVSLVSRNQPVARAKRDWKTALIAAAAGAIAAVMVTGIVLVARRSSPVAVTASIPWDQAHRAELLALKATADDLYRQQKWQESYDAYQQILRFVGAHELTDPVAISIIQAAGSGQDRAMEGLMPRQSLPGVLQAGIPDAVKASTKPVLKSEMRGAGESFAATQATTLPVLQFDHLSTTAPATAPTTPSATQPVDAMQRADEAPALAGVLPAPSLHAYTLPDTVSDEEIGLAINKGVQFLAAQFQGGELRGAIGNTQPGLGRPGVGARPNSPSNLDNGSNLGDLPTPAPQLPTPPNFAEPWKMAFSKPGVDALAVYALLNAGRAMDVPGLGVNDPLTESMLDQLKRYDMVFTYHRSLRAAALAVFNRTQDNAALEEDVRWLQAASIKGGYSYTLPINADVPWDNSNSQYGLLGVWSGAQAGKAVSQSYWQDVERHWNSCAIGDGTWGYSFNSAPTTTMTCAAIASLLVARDYLDSPNLQAGTSDRPTPSPTLDKGISWLDAGDNCMTNLAGDGMGGTGYGLYGLERVGLASGFKYFGKHDWYAELAKRLVAEQHLNGAWGAGGPNAAVVPQMLIDTSYALLFLSRGRHPILFNKLRYEGPWNNRPHDAAHLTRYGSHELERPLNWQVVNLKRSWFDWMDCPVLYIAGDKKLNFAAKDYEAIRNFALAGGLIFTHADGGSAAFNKSITDMVRTILPAYELKQVPRDHPLYSAVYNLKNPPPLLAVSNGSRLLLVHSPTDIAGGWQLNWTDEKKPAFQMGVNLFVYAAGKGNLKNRLASSYIPVDPDRPDRSLKIARLTYPGAWDPEPYAWTRFGRYFQWETHASVEPINVELKLLTPGSFPMAHLTGTVRYDFTDAECATVRAYVESGGVLLIDACGGQTDFVKSVRETLLPKAFGALSLSPIADGHPLRIASRVHADDLTHPMLRSFAVEHNGKNLPIETLRAGKGWVVFSPLDITTGLLGTQSQGILGFDPAYAQSLMKNAILWSIARSEDVFEPQRR